MRLLSHHHLLHLHLQGAVHFPPVQYLLHLVPWQRFGLEPGIDQLSSELQCLRLSEYRLINWHGRQ
jgi:hypothetical protein